MLKTTQTGVLVIGMHQSGMSVVTRVLSALGLDLTTRVIPATPEKRPKFWESVELRALHDEALASCDSWWGDWRRIPPEWFMSDDCRRFGDRLIKILKRNFANSKMFVIEDPRICRLAPVWLHTLAQLDIEPLVVITVRDPAEVTASLAIRNRFDPLTSQLLWLRHVLDAERYTRGVTRSVVTFDNLLSNWRSTVSKIGADLRIEWPVAPVSAAAAIEGFLSPESRHHSTVDDYAIPPWVAAAYEGLLGEANEKGKRWGLQDWERLAGEFDRAASVFGGLLSSTNREVRAFHHEAVTYGAEVQKAAEPVTLRRLGIEAIQQTTAFGTAELKHALADHTQEVETLKVALAAREARVAELDQALAARSNELEALEGAMAVQKARVAELDRALAGHDGEIVELRQRLADHKFQTALSQSGVSAIHASISWRITSPLRAAKRMAKRLGDAIKRLHTLGWRILSRIIFIFARAIYRALPFQNHQTRIRLRYTFLRYFDFILPQTMGTRPTIPMRSGIKAELLGNLGHSLLSSDISAHFLSPTDELLHDDGYSVPRFMYYLWRLRPDLRQAFDVYDRTSRLEYCKWFLLNASNEYAVSDDFYSDELLVKLSGTKGSAAAKAKAILHERNKSASETAVTPSASTSEPELVQDVRENGVNLIGYCRGEFGMGEQVRAMARALSAVQSPFSMIDSQRVGSHGSGDDSTQHWITNVKEYHTNIFCINADTFPFTYFSLGRPFFSNSYNIGYWAWELSKCPPEFDLALNMVDEVWAISEFVTQSFLTRSTVPVINMPQAVSRPVLRQQYSKSYFGLPENCFQFMFIFDGASYIERKNPIAAVRAFRLAFPRGDEKVRLLLKAMNTHSKDPLWNALIAEAKMDPRIAIIDKRFERDRLLGLVSVCDAFVSLHRSEGFGFNLAEAMVLGKPVIATNYSGSREFAREGTACVVDYQLVPVPEGSYLFSQHQFWAEPDVEHAATLMRRLVSDESYREHVAGSGQRFVLDNFNEAVIGARYAARLGDLRSRVFRSTPAQSAQGTPIAFTSDIIAPLGQDDEIVGFIDQPLLDGSRAFHVGSIEITGWATSKVGIKSIEIFCDGISCGVAFHGVLRPDIGIAFPDFKEAGRAGYFWILDATSLAAGHHVVRVVARSHSGLSKEWTRSFGLSNTTSYQQWLSNNRLDSKQKKLLVARADALKIGPAITIQIVCPSIVDRRAISRSLASLAGQLYQNFKVVIAAAETQIQCLQPAVDTAEVADRVRILPSGQRRSAQGLYDCDGDFVGVMDFGDVLDPRALLAVAENIARDSSIDFLYADEDRWRDGVRIMPTFKPAFSPIYLDRYNYIGRPWFARTSLIKKVTEMAEPTEGLSEHEVLRRLGRAAGTVCHIPMVLASRSFDVAGSTQVDTQPVEDPAVAGTDEILPRISIVIPTCLHKREIVTRCFNGLLERTDYSNFEVIVVLNNVPDTASARTFLGNWPFTVRVWEGDFNWSGLNNYGAKAASGDYLLFLNDDVEPVDPGWLKQMVRIARLKLVGAVGVTLKYPNNVIQHGGITISNYAASRRHCGRHIFRFCSGQESHIAPIVHHDHECRAVTGACLLTRRECFNEINGFDENLEVVTNDTDYCLRLGARGYSIVISASVLTHHEGISRTGIEEVDDLKRFWKRWGRCLPVDDFFTNPNLDRDKDDWSVSVSAVGSLVGRMSRKADLSKKLFPGILVTEREEFSS